MCMSNMFREPTTKLGVLSNIVFMNSFGTRAGWDEVEKDEREEDKEDKEDENWMEIITNTSSLCLKDNDTGETLTLSVSGNKNKQKFN